MSSLRRLFLCGRALACAAVVAGMGACERPAPMEEKHTEGGASPAAPAPTNRVDIPSAVRQNLGITFATVESRKVTRTLRVPGRFELLPTARREYRAAVPGRVELLVSQYERVEQGQPLYRVESPEWRDLHERINAAMARAESMGPLREAHHVHERSLANRVTLWRDRVDRLEELRAAGGGTASQVADARASLVTAEAELAEVLEKEAGLEAEQRQVESELRSLVMRRDLLLASGGCAMGGAKTDESMAYTVCSLAPGAVEMLGVSSGGLAEANGLVLTVVQPERIRFRARGLQSDLGSLRDDLPVLIVPPQGGTVGIQDAMSGRLRLGLSADADERTVDLLIEPESILSWARAGVSAHAEITLEGGSEELAIPMSAVVRDGATPIIFRRDPANADKVIRMEADVGRSDGRWIEILSGVKAGDQVVLDGNYQLMLATSGSAPKGGHFHSDGTFHEGEH